MFRLYYTSRKMQKSPGKSVKRGKPIKTVFSAALDKQVMKFYRLVPNNLRGYVLLNKLVIAYPKISEIKCMKMKSSEDIAQELIWNLRDSHSNDPGFISMVLKHAKESVEGFDGDQIAFLKKIFLAYIMNNQKLGELFYKYVDEQDCVREAFESGYPDLACQLFCEDEDEDLRVYLYDLSKKLYAEAHPRPYEFGRMCYEAEKHDEARKWLEDAHRMNQLDSCLELGDLWQFGKGGPEELEKARLLYKNAAEKNDCAESMYRYAFMCMQNDDVDEASIWANNANSAGHPAALELSLALRQMSTNSESDLAELREVHLQKIEDRQDLTAMFNYGFMLYHGQGGEIDEEKAMAYWKKAADAGDFLAAFVYANAFWKAHKDSVDDRWMFIVDRYLDKAISRSLRGELLTKMLMAKHQFQKYKAKKEAELLRKALEVSKPEQELTSVQAAMNEELTTIDFPDLEEDSGGEGDFDESVSLDDEDSMVKNDSSQWEVDRKAKKSMKYRQWCQQSMRVTQQQLEDASDIQQDEGAAIEFTLPPKLDMGLLHAIFGLNGKKITNYTPVNAMGLFEKFGCNVGEMKESFHIEYKDKDGIIHKFSSHKSHGHGKENKLYHPTDLYLKRFCNTIGLTQEVTEAYQG